MLKCYAFSGRDIDGFRICMTSSNLSALGMIQQKCLFFSCDLSMGFWYSSSLLSNGAACTFKTSPFPNAIHMVMKGLKLGPGVLGIDNDPSAAETSSVAQRAATKRPHSD